MLFITIQQRYLLEMGSMLARMSQTAEERYRDVLVEYADILPRLRQKDVAAYLGITQVGMSRIAARVRAEWEAGGAAPAE